jgi:NADPH-dependent 2,4-dienoyl-CoA reductase/sulfur reductase-like enzyme/nitrite reductase/ring-hydroxylating ferredoxin subunit
MSGTDPTKPPSGPDFSEGIEAAALGDGKSLLGHFQGEAVLLARQGSEVFAVAANCPHYGGPLAEGLVVGDTIRCPWHHACFSLRTGELLRAPALDGLACFAVEKRGDQLVVLGKAPASRVRPTQPGGVAPIVIVGGGAAGHAAAETLRREGYGGELTLLSADASPPCDRPNLSKDYLAGQASEDWIPLRPPSFFEEQQITLVLDAAARRIDPEKRLVVLENGRSIPYGTLLLATGSAPIKLEIPGAELPHVRYLRTLADSRAIIAATATSKRALVLGASFIGLEVAASLRARGIEVHVAAPDAVPFERVLGVELGKFIQKLHEEHGVTFHLGRKAKRINSDSVELDDGSSVRVDLVVAGIGVRPSVTLAETAGAAVERGVLVDAYLRTSVPGIFAAGDIARWPDFHSGKNIRIEHWVVAERLGQIAALNMLGRHEPCRVVPFFWTQQYDLGLHYVGHAESWDELAIDGEIATRDCRIEYRQSGRTLAVVTLGRDQQSLAAELEMERGAALYH